MKCTKSKSSAFVIFGVVACVTPAYADGLGGLSAMRDMFLILVTIVSLGIFALTLNLFKSHGSKSEKNGKRNAFALVATIIFLLAGSPFIIAYILRPHIDLMVSLFIILYIAVLTTGFPQLFKTNRHRIIFLGAFFLMILLRKEQKRATRKF